jgi:ABC-type oligopeptide transport system substrate-binding subunit/class 3 adenylate cyclase/ribosomal protein L40E
MDMPGQTLTCSKCGFENPDDAVFCQNCGEALLIPCPKCHTQNVPDVNFCKKCGAVLESAVGRRSTSNLKSLQQSAPRGLKKKMLAAKSQIHGERRPVTILFTDIVGSTSIASKMDPEDWREIVADVHQRVSEAIYRYEGTITQLLGDGVLAFFGAPIAHEDDPIRAVHAALEIQESILAYSQEITDQVPDFQMRAGINTGTVVIGDIGTDLHVEYLAFGDAVNVAARLESAAEPGTVLVSKATHKLIAPAFECVDLGKVQVKGKEEPIPIFRAVRPKEKPGKLRGIEGLESPLVGREREYQALVEALERLSVGQGGIATIVGEAGLGKSRLVAELRMQATEMNLNWIEGRCLSFGSTIPYQLWLDVLREFLEVKAEDSISVIHEKLNARIRELCPDRYDNIYRYLGNLLSLPLGEEIRDWILNQDGEQIRAGTFDAIEAFISMTCQSDPHILICEDLHWADPTSIQLLKRLLGLAVQGRVLLICVFRPEKDHISWTIRESAAEHYPERHIDLTIHPLSIEESNELMGNLVGVEGLPSELRDRILSSSEGNPFYVEEIIRSLIDGGALKFDELIGDWKTSSDITDIAIPDTLQSVLLARIDRLQQDTKRVLQMASVIGRIFLYRVLGAMAEESRALDGHLERLTSEDMIRERQRIPELEYIFKHHLTQEAAYNGLLKKERRLFHRQVAEAFEDLFPDRIEELLGILAYHWEHAEETEKATEFLLRAGDQARIAYAHQEAVDYYERALKIFKSCETYDRAARVLMLLGLTYHSSFEFQRSQQAYDEAFELAKKIGAVEPVERLPVAPHALRMEIFNPIILDPQLIQNSNDRPHISSLFSGLLAQSSDMGVIPDVAKRWEVLDGGMRYIFHLRDDVYWTDGVQVTAHDFEYSWKWLMHPERGLSNATILEDIKNAKAYIQGELAEDHLGIRTIDELTLEIELERPTSFFPHVLTEVLTFPIPRHQVEEHGPTWSRPDHIVTNGPFKVVGWNPGESLLYERNSRYHGQFDGNVERIEISFQDNCGGRLVGMYEQDQIDFVRRAHIRQEDWERMRRRYASEYISCPDFGMAAIGFDCSCTPFEDVRVRQAFAMATDRERIANVLLKGNLYKAIGGLIPPGMPGHSPSIGIQYNPQEARRLMAEAGYPEGRNFPEMDFMTQYVPTYDHIVPEVCQQYREILGVDLKRRLVDLKWFRENPRPHLWSAGEGPSILDPISYLSEFTEGARAGWQNSAFDELIASSLVITDHAERIRIAKLADAIITREAPVLPVFYLRDHVLVKPWVRGFPILPPREWILKEIIIEPH